MSDCQGKVGTSGTGLTNVIAPLSLTGTDLIYTIPSFGFTEFKTQVTATTTVTDVTDFSVKITPKYSSSKILVYVSIAFGFNANSFPYVLLTRKIGAGTATVIGSGNQASGSRKNVFLAGTGTATLYTDVRYHQASKEIVDAPATTSEITYQIQLATGAGGGAGVGHINRQGASVDDDYIQFPTSCIRVLEIFV
jgi:hypothetical protein